MTSSHVPNLASFHRRVKELYQRSDPYTGRRVRQQDLADAIGLSREELSRRLNGNSSTQLNERDVRAIIRTLAEWGAIQTQDEAHELLVLAGCAAYSAAEWQAPPLANLSPRENVSTPSPLPLTRHNLPRQLTAFVGRERALEELAALAANCPILTLVGPGGVGKTRLALELARRIVERYRGGVWWVELAGLHDPTLLPQVVANALGLIEQPKQSLAETLERYLQERQLLLVFDNGEHMAAPLAEFIAQLMRRCSNLSILVTSRAVLRVAGETVWRVTPLTLPPDLSDRRQLLDSEAVQLFVARASLARPGYQLSAADAPQVAEICRRLDGLPLALELAAARLRQFGLHEIVSRLHNRFQLLSSNHQLALEHQQTLYTTINWSYKLLNADEQALFLRLCMFESSFNLEAAELICADTGVQQPIYNLLGQLVDKSLVVAQQVSFDQPLTLLAEYKDIVTEVVEGSYTTQVLTKAALESEAGQMRYQLLESIREYGRSLGSNAELGRHHAQYYLQLAERAEAELEGSGQLIWLKQLDMEHDNLRQALDWSIENGEAAYSLRLAAALRLYWDRRGHHAEAHHYLSTSLKLDRKSVAVRVIAKATAALAYFVSFRQSETAIAYYREALALYQQDIDQAGIASTLLGFGASLTQQGHYAEAAQSFQESLALYRQLNSPSGIAAALIAVGMNHHQQGDYITARTLLEESLTVSQQSGILDKIARAHLLLGYFALSEGLLEVAQAHFSSCIALQHQLGNIRALAEALTFKATVERSQENYQAAQQSLLISLTLQERLGNRNGLASILENLGQLAQAQGELTAANNYFTTSLKLYCELGQQRGIAYGVLCLATLHPVVDVETASRRVRLMGAGRKLITALGGHLHHADQEYYDIELAKASTYLDAADIEALQAEGAALSQDETIAYALNEP